MSENTQVCNYCEEVLLFFQRFDPLAAQRVDPLVLFYNIHNRPTGPDIFLKAGVIPDRTSLVLIVKTMLVSKEFNLISKPSFFYSLSFVANCMLLLQ